MKAKDLAEMMVNGDLPYGPEDAYFIASKYIELSEAVMKCFLNLPDEAMKEINEIMCEDPALQDAPEIFPGTLDALGGLKI
jgi:hypothetical protein